MPSKEFLKEMAMRELIPAEVDERTSFEIMLDRITDIAVSGEWAFTSGRKDERTIEFRMSRGFEMVSFEWDTEDETMISGTHATHLNKITEVYDAIEEPF